MTTFMHPGTPTTRTPCAAASDGDATRDRPPCPVAGTGLPAARAWQQAAGRITPRAGTFLIPRGMCRNLPERPE